MEEQNASKGTMERRLSAERTRLSNERTLLAYIRTFLGAVGVAIATIAYFGEGGTHVAGIAVIILAGAVLVFGIVRYVRIRSMVLKLLDEDAGRAGRLDVDED